MAKKRKAASPTKSEQPTFFSDFSLEKFIPSKFQIPFFILAILILFLIFLSPLYFGGKTFFSGDIVSTETVIPYLEKERDDYTLWNPYVFGGMPAYAIAVGPKWFNAIWSITYIARSAFASPFAIDYAKWTFFLLALAYTMFVFFNSRTKNILVSFLVAVSVSLSTGLIVFLYIGHVTKLTSLWVFPVLLLMLLNFQKRIRLFDITVLIIFLNIMFHGWHVQIIFYIFFAVLIYFIYYLLRALKLKDNFLFKQLLKSGAVFFIAVVIALLIQLDNFTQIYEYTPFSTRGTESIVEKQNFATQQSESEFYQYATNWSFSPGEVLTFIIPSFYGFGKSVYEGPLTNNQPYEVNTYFGQMPFVDVAMYMGVVIFFLALFSIVTNWKEPLVRYLTILAFISLLISFGRTFPVLYDLMFYYFPFFDKFRVPSMILVLVQITFPILAGFGLVKIISLKEKPDIKIERLIRNTALVFGVLFICVLIFSSPIKDWFVDRVIASGQKGAQLKPLYDYMSDMFFKDALIAFLFSGLTFGLAYAYLKSKLSADLLIILIIIISVADLIRIDKRGETYVERKNIDAIFEKPAYLKAIDNQNDKSIFRVLNLKQDGSIGSLNQNSNFLAYFLHYDIYGYSGIKPRAIQDYYDVLGSPANPTFWRMLNVKYLIFDRQINFSSLELIHSDEKSFTYLNLDALPRAYFVNRVEKSSGLEILNLIKNNQFDPAEVAFVEDELENIESPDSTAYVNIVEFNDNNVTFDVNASGNNFLFFGDTYMTGKTDYKLFSVHTGWKAFIDGNETQIYKTNHGFRGIVVPEGNHKIEFVYSPESFYISKYISQVISLLVLLAFILLGLNEYLKRRKAKIV